MAQNAGNLRTQLAPVRLPQGLDLLGKIIPIERQIRASQSGRTQALGPPQHGCVLLGPAHEVFVVERVQSRHRLIALGQMMVFSIFACKQPRSPMHRGGPI
jgi:hypothetical protein